MLYKNFVYSTELSPDDASTALERELGRITVGEDQEVSGHDVYVRGTHYWLSTPMAFGGKPTVKARFEVGPQGTELRGSFRHLEPLYFLLLIVVLGVAPFFTNGKLADWGFAAGALTGAVMLALEIREGLGMFRGFRLVAEEALGDGRKR